jgi:hypothetical protein
MVGEYKSLVNSTSVADIESLFGNSTLQVDLGAQFVGAISILAYFSLSSATATTLSTYTWALNTTSNQVVGPELTEYPIYYSGPLYDASSSHSSEQVKKLSTYGGDSETAADYEYYDVYTGIADSISAASANVNVVHFTEPPSNQRINHVYDSDGVYQNYYRFGIT